MIRVSASNQVVELLQVRVKSQPALLVTVDGLPGSGKSTLSRELAREVPAVHIAVDSFLRKQQGTYLAHLRTDELSDQVARELSVGRVVLVDAVCADAVMDRIGVASDFKIYVKRLDDRGEWYDGEIFTGGLKENEAVMQEEELAQVAGGTLSAFTREIFHYHFAFKPWDHADIIYERRDAPAGLTNLEANGDI